MFEAKAVVYLYCVSPLHMGAGTAIGAIDNPIQRERHTGHPVIAGSGLKGAMRHEANVLWEDNEMVNTVFGPDPESKRASDYAGALSVADAQIVLFPVRSLRRSYVYATCPAALARLQRLLAIAEFDPNWTIPEVDDDHCLILNNDLLAEPSRHLVLEAYAFQPDEKPDPLRNIASWLAQHCVPSGKEHAYFRDKIAKDTVLLSDNRFNYFVRNSTLVEPHVRISDETGTADDGGLFYTENLPPESLLVSILMASRDRRENDRADGRLSANDVIELVKNGPEHKPGFDGRMIQVGGDSTVGRGQLVLRFVS